MRDIEQDVSPESMARANEANYTAIMAGRARVYGGEVREEPDMLWYVIGLPISFLNGVACSNLVSEILDDRITWAIERVRALNLPFSWRVGPSTQPSELADRLARHGLIDEDETPAMGVELVLLPEMPALRAGVTIEQVRDHDTLG